MQLWNVIIKVETKRYSFKWIWNGNSNNTEIQGMFIPMLVFVAERTKSCNFWQRKERRNMDNGM